MQRLILMRHAEAVSQAESGRDRDRPLSPAGRADARRMGQALAQRRLRPDLALVSDAVRTRQTWDQAHEALGDVDVRLDERLYNAEAEVLRRAVEAVREEAGCLIVVAHNPGIHLLALEYLSEGAASPTVLERFGGGFPTGALAVFGLDPAGRPGFEGFLRPADLNP